MTSRPRRHNDDDDDDDDKDLTTQFTSLAGKIYQRTFGSSFKVALDYLLGNKI